jgi:periplasmic protein TonB
MAPMGAPAEKPVERPADEPPADEAPRHRFLGAIDEDNLFATATAVMDGDPKVRGERMRSRLRFSVIAHLVILALIIFVPLFMPETLPEQGDRRVVFFDPPPPPPPPMQKGSSARPEQAKPEPPKKVVETPKTDLTPPIEQQPVDKPLEPEKGVKPEEQFGSETGSDLGDALGMEGGVEGGQVGGVPGGVLGGVIGGTGTGPVMDYDTPPRPIKQPRPQYPQEAFIKKIEGTVLVEILIDAQGRVARARVVQSVPMLDAAALQTVYQWVFMPAMKHGKPVATLAHIPVAFRIY